MMIKAVHVTRAAATVAALRCASLYKREGRCNANERNDGATRGATVDTREFSVLCRRTVADRSGFRCVAFTVADRCGPYRRYCA